MLRSFTYDSFTRLRCCWLYSLLGSGPVTVTAAISPVTVHPGGMSRLPRTLCHHWLEYHIIYSIPFMENLGPFRQK